MLVVNRFRLGADEAADFTDRARLAIEALAARPGFVRADFGRAYDDPACWMLVTEWESVGAYRRALGAFDVKVQATPLLAQSLDEPSAFEILGRTDPTGALTIMASDRAPDPNNELRSRP